MAFVNQAKQARKTGGPGTSGPVLIFTGSVAIALMALAVAGTAMPRDFALATVSTVFFAIAALVALFAWRAHKPQTRDTLSYWDVAGALTLIGICAAAFLDSDQIIRLIESRRTAG
jgi:hypothetical protein